MLQNQGSVRACVCINRFVRMNPLIVDVNERRIIVTPSIFRATTCGDIIAQRHSWMVLIRRTRMDISEGGTRAGKPAREIAKVSCSVSAVLTHLGMAIT